jgi:hypothetical protein
MLEEGILLRLVQAHSRGPSESVCIGVYPWLKIFMTRNGKIARLPRDIRDQLNRRLRDGEPGSRVVEWLNSLPETQRVLAADFGGRLVSEQNLSEWKQGGYSEWLGQQEAVGLAREFAADAEELSKASGGLLTDHLTAVLTARYARLLAGWNGEVSDEFRRKLRALRVLSQDIVELRRGDHWAARLKIEQARLDREEDWTEEELIEHFQKWARNPKVRDWICNNTISAEESARRIRQIFGLQEPAESAGADEEPDVSVDGNGMPTPDTGESDSIKPNQTG